MSFVLGGTGIHNSRSFTADLDAFSGGDEAPTGFKGGDPLMLV